MRPPLNLFKTNPSGPIVGGIHGWPEDFAVAGVRGGRGHSGKHRVYVWHVRMGNEQQLG